MDEGKLPAEAWHSCAHFETREMTVDGHDQVVAVLVDNDGTVLLSMGSIPLFVATDHEALYVAWAEALANIGAVLMAKASGSPIRSSGLYVDGEERRP